MISSTQPTPLSVEYDNCMLHDLSEEAISLSLVGFSVVSGDDGGLHLERRDPMLLWQYHETLEQLLCGTITKINVIRHSSPQSTLWSTGLCIQLVIL